MKRLEGKIAVVTGASRGIGRAVAIALAYEGVHVVVTARNGDELNSLVQEVEALGVQGLAVAGDASEEPDVNRLKDETLAQFGHVDILVNNTGVGKFGTLETLTLEDYDWMMDTNMRSTFLVSKAFVPAMKERGSGSVIFVGSVAGMKGLPNETIYCASKHAQMGFAQSLDFECREKGVKVSYVAPGGVNTYFAFGTGRTEGDPQLQEYLDSEDVADAVVFAAAQPPKARVFLIGMRPMRETL